MSPYPIRMPRTKRIFDIVVTLFLIIVCSPIIAVIEVFLFFESLFISSSRGPLLYKETRISRGKPFVFYKFRIFKIDRLKNAKNGNGVIHTKTLEQNKENMTHVGRILKQVYLDELPQLWNVLKGDMSLVGPRPTNVENYEHSIKRGHLSKKLIHAGITGYFQSHKGEDLEQTQEELDLKYIQFVTENPGWKIMLYDIKMLVSTLITIFRAEGI